MKKTLTLLIFLAAMSTLFGQASQFINYQAVARHADGKPMTNTTISLRFRILEGGPNGAQKFLENQTADVNAFGLFTAQIGSINSNDFAAIDWSSGAKWLEVTINNNSALKSSQQLASVPYALYAERSKFDIAIFEEQKNPGESWQGTAAEYSKRLLNVEVLSSSNVQLTGNNEIRFLQPGTYIITAYAFAYQKGRHKVVLRRVGGASDILMEGSSEYCGTQNDASTRSTMVGKLVVPSSNFTCRLEHYSSFPNQGTFGREVTAPGSAHETYAQVIIQKIQ